MAGGGRRCHGQQDALDGTARLRNGKGFRETRRATLLQERLCGGLQRIAREEDKALAEVGLLALQEPVETRAIEFRHAHVAQDAVIGARVSSRARARRPFATVSTVWPSRCSSRASPLARLSSSSTTRIVPPRTASASSTGGGVGGDAGTAPPAA